MAETLAQSLRTTSLPTDPTAALLRGNSIQERGKTARELVPSLLTKGAEAAGELKRSELQAESQKAGREAAALEESGRKMREETGRIRAQEQPYQEFKAPEYTAFDYAKGAATRALTAVILGGVAKTSALTQLKAIKAMQDAEKEGRQNDFLNAQLTFNEAEKKRVDFNERLKRDLDDFEKLLQTDTKTAMAKAKVMTSDMQDGLVKRLIDSQRFGEAIKVARNNIEVAQDLEKQLTIKAAEAAGRRDLEELKAQGKGEGAKIKMTAEPEKRLTGARESLEALLSIEERLKKPEVQKALDQSEFLRTMLEKPTEMYPVEKFVRSQLYKNLPTEAKELFVVIAQARNDYYRQISGQAVTGSEGARNFFATIQPTDSADTLLTKSRTMKPKFIRQLGDFESDYELGPGTQQRLRELIDRASEDQRPTAQSQGTATPAVPQPQVNKDAPLTQAERQKLEDLRRKKAERESSQQ
jgi:hypothetical protein